jgi:hypothetical protein
VTGARLVLGVLLLALATPLAASEPLAIRDQNPLIRGLYLPVWSDDLPAGDRFAQRFTLTVSNTTNLERATGEALRVDGEALELRWLLSWQPLDGLQVRFTLPLVYYSGGTFDDLVDGWHELFGLSDGSRPLVPSDDLMYYYLSDQGMLLEKQGGTAFGDAALEAGLQLHQSDRVQVSAWLGIEAPTGDSSRLTGNDHWDVGTWLEYGQALNDQLSVEARVGVVRPGSAAPLPLPPSDWVAFGSLGTTWEASPALAVRLQLDAHDGMVEDTALRFLGEVLQLSVGAQLRSAGGWRWEIALTEDLRVDASPDFALQLSLHIGGGDAP